MIKRSIASAFIALTLASPALAIEIRNTEDCQAAQRAQDGIDDLGFDALLQEAMTGSYGNYAEWKSSKLTPTIKTFEQRFPLTPADAMRLPNYASFVTEFSFRTEQMAYHIHQMQRHKEGSKEFEQYRSSARVHLNAMNETMARFRKDCIIE
ncbi:hypothetical protein CGX12_11795 [Zobellella denitrificans]|uniref:hypothetical protein n=1 Tax=Zobellella denitrificans TaxID=347534 RepID=UPI000B8C133C|nr:hypothetical protein [Zobellella denitrificans]OXS14896.1 hypothetical protein CGX12_11795 [Zobellella denitrificans]